MTADAIDTPGASFKSTPVMRCVILGLMCVGFAMAVTMYWLNGATDFWPVYGIVFVPLIVIGVSRRLVRNALERVIKRVDNASNRSLWLVTLLLAMVTTICFPLVIYVHSKEFRPRVHDELSYAVMAQIYATGRLWMPAHPLGESLGSFYLFTEPVYGSMYFPGTGLLYAVALLLGAPLWVMSCVIAGVCVGLVFRLLLHKVAASIAIMTVLTLIVMPHFQWFAMNIMSHMPLLMCVLIAVLSYLNWFRFRKLSWLWVLSISTGFALITRPLDAVLLLLPIAMAIVIELLRNRAYRQTALALGIACAGILPFVILQLVINHAFTGRWSQTPHEAYVDRFMPDAGLGFNVIDPTKRPDTLLQQKVVFYDTFALPSMLNHQHPGDLLDGSVILNRWSNITYGTMITPLLWAAALPGYWLLCNRKFWPLAVAPFFLLAGLLLFPFLPTWYVTGALGSNYLAIATSIGRLSSSTHRIRRCTYLGVLLALGVTCVVHIPFVAKQSRSWIWPAPELSIIDEVIARQVRPHSLVFFTFNPAVNNVHWEPVYNIANAWPDDASVIRVHDMGAEANMRVLNYYQLIQPDRWVYAIDRSNRQLFPLGNIINAKDAITLLHQRDEKRPSTKPAVNDLIPSSE